MRRIYAFVVGQSATQEVCRNGSTEDAAHLRDMPLDPYVRLATSDDAARVAAIEVATRQVAFAGIVPSDILRDRYGYDNRLQTWRNRLGDPTSNAAVFIAEQGGEAWGYVMAGDARDGDAAPHCGEIYDLYVLPRSQTDGCACLGPGHGADVARLRTLVGQTDWQEGGSPEGGLPEVCFGGGPTGNSWLRRT